MDPRDGETPVQDVSEFEATALVCAATQQPPGCHEVDAAPGRAVLWLKGEGEQIDPWKAHIHGAGSLGIEAAIDEWPEQSREPAEIVASHPCGILSHRQNKALYRAHTTLSPRNSARNLTRSSWCGLGSMRFSMGSSEH